MSAIERAGQRIIHWTTAWAAAGRLLLRTARTAWEEGFPHGGLVARAFLMQIWFTGIQALPLVMVAALAFGVITIYEAEILLRNLAEPDFVERTVVFLLIREIPAILVMMILIARSGTAITTEIANMRLNRETEALTLHGVPPETLVILPRLAAFPLAAVCLTFYFILGAVGGGVLALPLIHPHPASFSFQTIHDEIQTADVLLPTAKALLFGLLTALVCCANGLSVRRSFREVPQAATRGVTASFMICLVLNTILSAAAVR